MDLRAPRVRVLWAGAVLVASQAQAEAPPSGDASSSGAPAHWAYQPVRKPVVPAVRDIGWPKTDIDRFVLAKLEGHKLRPVDGAERATLGRRLFFDLIGLPPTAEQLSAFERDASPQAVEQLVDSLLASPRFGERWARHWLDVARYGESVTLRGFIFREAWRYRDYVIDAFNRELPYDQFIREQIAGDLLPASSVAERQRQHVAITFLALGNTNFEEQDKKQLEMDVVDEQLDTIGKAILGQTIGCARCHDHKFDPIPTRDYYAMAGILRNSRLLEHANVSKWIEAPLPLAPDDERVYAEHEAKIAALEKELKAAKDQLKSLAVDGRADSSNRPVVVSVSQLPGIVVDSSQAKAVGEWKHSQYSKHYIGDGYLHDLNEGKGEKTLTFMPELPRAGRYEVRLAYVQGSNRAAGVPVTIFHADGETLVRVDQNEPPLIETRFVSLGQFRFEANNFSYVLVSTEGTKGYVIADAVQFLPAEMVERRESASGLNSSAPAPMGDLNAAIKSLEKEVARLRQSGPKRPMVMALKEENEIEDLHVHIRGSVHRLGEKAPRGFLSVATREDAPALPDDESGRRELAEWLASSSNPLTPRVFVNRVWHWLFGAGLVRTTDNFGTTGEAPSHPELLDYLAGRFVEHGWSVKKLVREIVLSRTYQLASPADDVPRRTATAPINNGDIGVQNADIDPDNRLLWRANRRRLEAECIRDAMLSISGELDLEAGGPSIPPDLGSDYGFQYGGKRRSVYVPVLRNAMLELFEAFDVADPSVTTGERNISTVAPQALYLMNHPFVIERARAAARRFLDKVGGSVGDQVTAGDTASDNQKRVELAYRSVLGRAPSAGENRVALKHLAEGAGAQEHKWTQLYHALFASADFRYLD